MKYAVFAAALVCAVTAFEHAKHIDVSDYEENWEERKHELSRVQNIINFAKERQVNHEARPVIGVLTEPVRGELFIPDTHTLEKYATEDEWISYVPRTHVQFLEQAGVRVVPIDYHLKDEDLVELLDQVNGLYLPGDSHMAVTDAKYREAFLTSIQYAEDQAYIVKEHFPVFMMGNTLQTYVRSKQQVTGTLQNMEDHRFSNSRVELITHPKDTFLFNNFDREKKHAVFNTAQFFNVQPSGVTPTSLQQEGSIRNKMKPVAVFSSLDKEDDDKFIAIAEGMDLPLYAFTYAIEMTQFYYEDPSATMDNFQLDHSIVARTHAQAVANLIAEEARLSEHTFRLPEEVFERLIRHNKQASVSYTSKVVSNESMPVGMTEHDIYILQ